MVMVTINMVAKEPNVINPNQYFFETNSKFFKLLANITDNLDIGVAPITQSHNA